MSTSIPSIASTNLGDKLADAQVIPTPRKTRTHLSDALKANIVAEMGKGASVDEIAARFGIGKSTASQIRFDNFGPARVRRTVAAVSEKRPNDIGMTTNAVARALGKDNGQSAHMWKDVSLNPQEARVLSLVVRDAVSRMDDGQGDMKGRLAVLALKLLG